MRLAVPVPRSPRADVRGALRRLVAARGCAVGDGAIGTMLQAAGLQPGESAERWNLDHADDVAALHRAYAAAGANLLTTNSFGGTEARLALDDLDDRVADVNRAAAAIARSVADETGCLVAGDVGPTGELLEPYGILSAARARELFAEQIAALVQGGADLVLIETMSDLTEAEAALAAAFDAAPGMDVVVTMSFDTAGRTMMGVRPADAVTRLGALGATAVGANCGRGLDDVEEVMAEMADARPPGTLLVAQANAGLPRPSGDGFVYDVSSLEIERYARRMRELGVEVVGACCGSTPADVATIAGVLAAPAAVPAA